MFYRKNEVLKGKLTFFFLHDGFSETWTGNLWFHVFWGFKIETKGDFIETRGFSGCGGRRPPQTLNTPGLNEYHLFVSIFEYPKIREYHRFPVQV